MKSITACLLVLCGIWACSCEKEDAEHKMDLSCGDSLKFYNLTGAKWALTFHDPVTDVSCSSMFVFEADIDNIVMQPYDGSYDNCLLGKHYVTYVMIDPSAPGMEGDWEFCQHGVVEMNNVIYLP